MKQKHFCQLNLVYKINVVLLALILSGCNVPLHQDGLASPVVALQSNTPTSLIPTITLTVTPTPSPTITLTSTPTLQPTHTLTPTPGWFSSRREIAYNVQFAGDSTAQAFRSRLSVLKLDGTRPEYLPENLDTITEPQWSPNGQKIAFVSSVTNPSSLYIREMETGQLDQINDVGAFVWSSDSQRIVYCASGNFLSGSLEHFPCYWVEITDLSHPHLLFVPEWRASELHWSPIEDRILAVGARERGADLGTSLYIFDLEGRVQQIPTQKPLLPGVSWHPDGTKIAYAPDPDTYGEPSQIRELDLLTMTERELTTLRLIGTDPQWSPDGNLLAYVGQKTVSAKYIPPLGETALIYILDTRTEKTRQVPGSRFDMSCPIWSPDGQYLAFQQWTGDDSKGYSLNIYEVATNKTSMIVYTGVYGYISPAWKPLP